MARKPLYKFEEMSHYKENSITRKILWKMLENFLINKTEKVWKIL